MRNQGGATGAIIVAAGTGSRMGLGYNKIFAPLCGKPVIEWTMRAFINSGLIDRFVLVVNPDDREEIIKLCNIYTDKIDLKIVHGGKMRQDSVYNGLMSLEDSIDIVLIHDAARPFVDKNMIQQGILYASRYGAACAGVPVKDTIKIADSNRFIIKTPERESLWVAQTPQSFKKNVILQAYHKAVKNNATYTDDAAIAESAGFTVAMFEGSYLNIKLTSKEDLIIAEEFIKKSGLI
jgi:2-C-methyl-D-erythritol 4-phosphate cytidylyltransferase